MKNVGFLILVIAAFFCGASLTPEGGPVALLCGAGFGGITAYFIFASSTRRVLGITLGLSSILAIIFSAFMFRTVPNSFPPYESGLMASWFPPEQFPGSKRSYFAIDARLHWFGFLGSLPISIGLILLGKLRLFGRPNRAQQDVDLNT